MAQTPSTLTTADYMLKEWYSNNRVLALTLNNNVLIDMLPRDTNFVGDVMPLPVLMSAGQGIASESLAIAQTNSNTASGSKFSVTVGETFGVIPLGSKVLKAARNNMGAFLDHRKLEIDQFLKNMGRNMNQQAHGDGGGSLGVASVVSATTDGTVTLSDKEKIVNFWKGMVIRVGENDGTDASHALHSGALTVATVDYNAGTFTFTGTSASFDAGDFIFREGQFAGNLTQTSLWKGIQAWCPASAPTDTLFGLARTGQSQLSGVRLESSEATGQINERIEKLAERQATRYGCYADMGVLHGKRWRELNRELQNQGVRVIKTGNYDATFGYRTLMFESGYGGSEGIKLYADRDCNPDTCFLLEKEYVKIWSMGELVETMSDDGLQMLRMASSAAYEIRYESYAQLAVPKPPAIARVSLS